MIPSIACAAFTARGAVVARRIAAHFGGVANVRPQDAEAPDEARHISIADWTAARFADAKAIVFVGATGIAVRAIAPLLQGKDRDPAVICVDENARFVISLLSGHLGGANELARDIAAFLGATPVISTATDGRGAFAADDWARICGYAVENVDGIAPISAAILDGQTVGFTTDAPLGIDGDLPEGLRLAAEGPLGICVSDALFPSKRPFAQTLFLRPPVLTLGVGCKRGTSPEALQAAIHDFLQTTRHSALSIVRVASIDLKADEAGLIALCARNKWRFVTHSADELMAIDSAGFSRSEFVERVAGVDCVCERSAALHGHLIVAKTRYSGITLALSRADWRVRF